MTPEYFIFALENAKSSDWEHFEKLSSRFLASDYPDLRTMASPSGDGGRDSELFSPARLPNIAFQYSVSKDWKAKILKTVARIKDTFPSITFLIYLTNVKIGADGDAVKRACIDKGIALDIRDLSWFHERMNVDANKQSAAESFCRTIAAPLLERQKIIEKTKPALTNIECKAALTYLAMQWEDERTDKGLSKVVYEALVISSLRNSDSDNRASREQIHKTIFSYLSSSADDQVKHQVDSALRRLTKKKIRHWKEIDEFCLTHEEVQRLEARLVEDQNKESSFLEEVKRLVELEMDQNIKCHGSMLQEFRDRIVRILDAFLVRTGEIFAASVATGEVGPIDKETVYTAVYSDISKYPQQENKLDTLPRAALNVIARLSSSENPSVRKHLRKLSDAYTLFAFLRETPDIQKATNKIFGHGKIWLDTTVVLPLLAEAFFTERERAKYTLAFSNLISSGVELRVTDGVIHELLNHIRVSQTCSTNSYSSWRGRIPYLYHNYIQEGYSPSSFRSAVDRFRGSERPDDDIGEYLQVTHGIKVESLEKAAVDVDNELRAVTERLWKEAHDARRSISDESAGFNGTTEILIRHDVESYLGIIGMRRDEQVSELGYKHWWLTIDSVAWKIRDKLYSFRLPS